MGISRVLEAMASGGLEAYNEDIQKQRDYNMMADLEIKKANIQKLVDGNDNRYFSAADGITRPRYDFNRKYSYRRLYE